MRQAIAKCKEGIAQGQSPFGAAIFKGNDLVSVAHNTVWRDTDPTAHAEVNAIRAAAKKLGTIDFTGYSMVTTCEPCPMCLTAIHWAHLDRVVYGATIEDAAKTGFSELRIAAKEMVRQGGSPLKVEGELCRDECAELFSIFLKSGKAGVY